MDRRGEVDGVDWLFEPDWPGLRCVARLTRSSVHLTDATGAPVDDAAIVAAMAGAVLADTATLDGIWAERGSLDDDGTAHPAFRVLDLLELDGTELHDVPFQERRRLAESIVREGGAVQVGQLVKQPLARWFPAWRAAGFSHYLARHQNARSHPGQQADDWLRIPLSNPDASPGFIQRVIGTRGPGSTRPRG
jgi:ATP-dependent DNA ligase